jgi:DEAD/DEAH box helicase domain-containing protein
MVLLHDMPEFIVNIYPSGTLHPPLSDTILQALRDARNITALYTHQVAAISAISNRKHVIVSTSTASGKSVIYQVLETMK